MDDQAMDFIYAAIIAAIRHASWRVVAAVLFGSVLAGAAFAGVLIAFLRLT